MFLITMRIYGNEKTKIYAIVEKIDDTTVLMHFDNAVINVPKSVIHSQIEPLLQKMELEIDTWFLKRNRIIPLVDQNFIW